MITPPSDPARGDDILPWALKVNRYLRAITPRPGGSVLPTIRSTGTSYEATAVSGGLTIPAPPSFDLSLALDKTGGTGTATFGLGLVNGKLPSNIFSSLSFTTSGTHYVKLQCATDGKSVNTVALAIDDTPPAAMDSAMGAAPLNFEVLLYALVNGTAFRAWNTGNVLASIQEAIRAPKTSTSPGGPAFDIYYTWRIESD
ncbi:MAG: hypothetical protein QM796_18665 [Chthoniobacteraceae bacterium]